MDAYGLLKNIADAAQGGADAAVGAGALRRTVSAGSCRTTRCI